MEEPTLTVESMWVDEDGGYSLTVATITPPERVVPGVRWRYRIEGEDVWHERITKAPALALRGLPPGVKVTFNPHVLIKEE